MGLISVGQVTSLQAISSLRAGAQESTCTIAVETRSTIISLAMPKTLLKEVLWELIIGILRKGLDPTLLGGRISVATSGETITERTLTRMDSGTLSFPTTPMVS